MIGVIAHLDTISIVSVSPLLGGWRSLSIVSLSLGNQLVDSIVVSELDPHTQRPPSSSSMCEGLVPRLVQ